MLWRALALLKGFKPAFDDEMGLLVVWHPTRAIHFTGPNAWRNAARS